MPPTEQFELFATDEPEVIPVPVAEPAQTAKKTAVKQEASLPASPPLNRDPMAIRTEGTEMLTDYLRDFSSSFYVVEFPRRLLSVFAFPLTAQESWKATHQSENYTIETGICEGCPERTPEVMTIRDFGYFIALYSLIKNAPIDDREVEVTLRHIAFAMAGFPKASDFPQIKDPAELARKTSIKSLIGGKKSKEFGQAISKAYGRHMHYTLPQHRGSSAPGTEHWLSMLNYEATRRTLNLGEQSGKFYRNFTIGSAFNILAPTAEDYVSFDCRQFFKAGTWIARAVLLKLMPRILAGGYNSRHKHLTIKASTLLRQIGAATYTYDRPAKMVAALQPVADALDKLESVLGTRIRAKLQSKPRGEPEFLIYIEKLPARKLEQSSLENGETFKLWLACGKSPETFWTRLNQGRKNKVDLNDDDRLHLDASGLNWRSMEHYLRLVKQLLHAQAFAQALADYKAAVREGTTSSEPQALTGFIKEAIRTLNA
ncbi:MULTISPECIES: hypothetical protein [unclassified Lentimonas]|uniref:hypothetical protein n=1 Tax=unclassified Lentimonas TaxID=2630993 RepID=UPI00132C19F7|nr:MULTISPECIES: hypothetical protein [unclassified Lentimonas]CAA6680232.1 Unannotated [Lentimonas sp. CC4]CAA6686082.1 Unannotated [Lentimonas sp. CC6]CAA7077723.1 Unannotated [Lentimonas sp. CC4]CAA7168460.1 Unannotated [Lentimonas sp. CC21]CAA7182973.1 Unannotated [Lentimonas sp. CC8]